MADYIDSRKQILQRWAALEQERSSWLTHWQEIAKYLLPRNGRFLCTDNNRGEKRHNAIYDSTGTRALYTLQAGMMSGMTSPARPWFKLATPDHDLNRYGPVKIWLSDVTQLMREVFQRSNTYRALQHMYLELGAFGTAASFLTEDYTDVIRHYPLTIGEFSVATDNRGMVNTLARKYRMTVGNIVREFGIANVSTGIKDAWDRHRVDDWREVIHIVQPREDRDDTKRDAKNMPWASTYIEVACDHQKVLRESGFEIFPALCPRWQTAGGDIYGHSPGMESLGDIKQLQQEQLRKGQGIDYMSQPPLQAPTAMKNVGVDSLPGGISYYDATSPHSGIRTQFEIRLDLNHLLADIQDVRGRIRSAFYADLFLMLANQTDARMTATEVAERHEEKLLMLGPVTESLHNELLDPHVDITFSRMLKAGILPIVPEELKGMDLNVEYVSVLAQAQRAVGTNSVDRFVSNLGVVAQIKPEVIDKLDVDEWADAYSDMLGVDPKMIIPGEQVALVRKQRAQAQAQAAQAEQQKLQSETVRNVGSVDPSQMGDVMNMFSGYSTPGTVQ